MDLQDLVGFAGIPGLEPAVGALFQIFQAVENIKVYKNQCLKLRSQCTDLLITLRDNGEGMVGTDYMKAVDEATLTIERISRKARVWSTWSKTKALIQQSEIRQGLDDLGKDLAHCATRFNMLGHMEVLNKQRDLRMVLGGNHAEIQETLRRLLDETKDIHTLLRQPERNIAGHMLNIQEAIYADVAEPEQRHSLQERLLKIHRSTELLPPMIDLTGEVRRIGEHPVNISGGYSDVFQGEWLGDEKVALKLTRGINHTPKAQKRFVNEVAIWRQLQHKNVARLYGVATLGNYIYAVSPWMEHRDALSYIAKNPNADRLKILCEVATGLEFLHKHGVVHGDLRAANILISEAEVACITDFGLSVILEEEMEAQSSSTTVDNHGNCRWMAPELISPELVGLRSMKPNIATDVWSYGMLCLEIFTGQRPFNHRTRAAAVISDIINGVRPTRPPSEVTRRGLSDALWGIVQQCWHQSPHLRPSMSDILARIKSFQSAARRVTNPPSPMTLTALLPPNNAQRFSRDSNISTVRTSEEVSLRRSSPILIPADANTTTLLESPSSITHSTSHTQPSTSGSGGSSSSNDLLATSSRITGRSNSLSRVAPPSHGKSQSVDVIPLQGKHSYPTRPSTASAAENGLHRLTPSREAHDKHETDTDSIEDIMAYLQSSFAESRDIPTVHVERVGTPRPLGVVSSLPTSFAAPAEHIPLAPVHLIIPSYDSGKASLDSGCSPASTVTDDVSRQPPLYIKHGKDGSVVAATLPGLVERLLEDSSDFKKDMQFREIFLASYQAFTNAEEVFGLLVERFYDVSSPQHTAEQRASIRYSVLTVLDLWLRGHLVQPRDIPLLERMRAFAMSIPRSAPTIVSSAQRLTNLIDSRINSFTISPSLPPLTPSSSSWSLRSPPKQSEITPHVFAHVLMVLEAERYCKIVPSDCIGWLKEIPGNNGVSEFIAENDKLSYWVQRSILKPDHLVQRMENLRYFLSVAEECRRMRNFSSSCALFAGIASSCITGLKRTSTLDKSSAKNSAGMEKLMSPDKNFKAYRKTLNSSNRPCVPWLRVHLHDVKVFHESQRTYIKQDGHTDAINFELYRLVHERIRNILSYQNTSFKPPDNPPSREVQSFVDSQLRSLEVDDALREWLRRRSDKLGREELADFNSHTQELMATGFIRSP